MSADQTEVALSRKLITLAEALEQTGARDASELRLQAEEERRRYRTAA